MQEARQKRPHFVQFCLYPKNQLTVKDPDAGKHERQEEKGTTEDEMVGWHHRLINKRKFSNIVRYTSFSIMKQTELANVTL